MLFDKFCKFAEGAFMRSSAPYATPMLKRSAIFSIDGYDAQQKAQSLGWVTTDEFRTLAVMPFDEVWIESGRSATLLSTRGDMLGDDFDSHRAHAIHDMAPLGYTPVEWLPSLAAITVAELADHRAYAAILGTQHFLFADVRGESRTQYLSIPGVHYYGHFDDRGEGIMAKVSAFDSSFHASVMDLAKSTSRLAIASLLLMNSPGNWVVRREHVKARPVQMGKVPRSDQRPRYIVVADREIERVIRDPNEANKGTVKPHRRRAHTHLLKSERFTWKRGERVFVKAAWVGPQQAEYGGERYRVCLDL